MKLNKLLTLSAVVGALGAGSAHAEIMAEKGKQANLVLVPKFIGILVFDQAHDGAREAHEELENPGTLEFIGPTPGEQRRRPDRDRDHRHHPGPGRRHALEQLRGPDRPRGQGGARGRASPSSPGIPRSRPREGEQVFVAQVDFDQTGVVMADMALSILGEEGGDFAILSATPDAANQNSWNAAMQNALKEEKYAGLNLVDIVYGDDQSEKSYNQALALIDKYPNMKLIMAPTSVGIVSASKALQDEDLCDEIKVSGLGLPAEMVSYTMNGCAPEFALWSFVDLGYLTYYVTYLIATGQMEGRRGRYLQRRTDGHVHESTRTRPARRDCGCSWGRSRSTTRKTSKPPRS